MGAKASNVRLTAGWFGLDHDPDRELAGAERGTIVGLEIGVIFAVTRRIWRLLCAYAAFDLTAYAMVYRNLESDVPHLILK